MKATGKQISENGKKFREIWSLLDDSICEVEDTPHEGRGREKGKLFHKVTCGSYMIGGMAHNEYGELVRSIGGQA
jgi:hypothetical protein